VKNDAFTLEVEPGLRHPNRKAPPPGVTQKLTPFTTLTLGANRQQDRFQIDPLRDMDSIHGTATVKFDPLALIAGTFAVAYSDYSPRSATVPAYTVV
jgi:hypothetical protein